MRLKRLYSSLALALLVALAPAAIATAVCNPGVQSCSSTYQVTESFFGSGGTLNDACSSGGLYCAKQSLGELTVGNSLVAYQNSILATGPVAYWRLGELSGTSMIDSTGNGHTGTYSGGYTLGSAGIPATDNDSAVAFDGSSGTASVPYDAALDFGTTNKQSVMFWYKGTQPGLANQGQLPGLVSESMGISSKRFNIGIRLDGTVSAGFGGSYDSPTGSTVINDGKWHQVVATLNYVSGGNSTIKLYVDGTLDGSLTTIFSSSAGTPVLDIMHNRRGAAGYQYTSGTLDELAMYNTILTPEQVSQTYTGGHQIRAGFNTDRSPFLEMAVNTPSVNVGVLDPTTTHVGFATFLVKTYLASGYQVVSASPGPKNGSYTMSSPTTPTASAVGTEQFGMNVVANTCPGTAPSSGAGSCSGALGANPVQDPDDTFSFGRAAGDYDVANSYMYRNGDAIANSNKSSGTTHYTISYIFNISSVTPGGTYTMDQSLVTTSTF